ncbi:MAG: BON domain-containing protein [Bacteroidia bacterium]
MKNDETLQQDVQKALKWEPLLHAAEIGVAVKDGIVTLTGSVDSYTKKREAEDASKKVTGVKAVIESIKVELVSKAKKDDKELADEVVAALRWNWQIPDDKIKVKVEDGWITLEGDLEWNYQREEAQKSLTSLIGIKGFTNKLNIKSNRIDEIEKKTIEAALARNWALEHEDILVKVQGNKVSLTGVVNSLYRKEEAGVIVWKTPGVCSLENELIVDLKK